LKLVLPGVTFTDPSLPKLYPDPIQSEGSLLLLDFAHSAGWTGDYNPPSTLTYIPNLAYEQAYKIIGSGSEQDLAGRYNQSSISGTESALHKVEFSGKKGLHVIVSQNPGLGSAQNFKVYAPSLIRDYIKNHIQDATPSGETVHDFFVSIWYKTTRPFGSGTAANFCFGQNSGNYGIISTSSDFQGRWNGAGTTNGVNKRVTPNQNVAGANVLKNTALNSFAGEKSSSDVMEMWWGRAGAWNGFMATNAPSFILYRMYVEDLTVSGRTYAEVDALDYALWQEAFASGGRFFGDTYTDPSTIP